MSTWERARSRIRSLTRAMSAAVAAMSRSTGFISGACFIWGRTDTAITSLLPDQANRVETVAASHVGSCETSHPGAMSLDQPADLVKHQTPTRDAFLGGRLTLSQPRNGFRAGLDSVLLGAAVPAGGTALLDLGAGAGAAGLTALALERTDRADLAERDPAMLALARNNVDENGFSGRASVLEVDVTARADARRAAGLMDN